MRALVLTAVLLGCTPTQPVPTTEQVSHPAPHAEAESVRWVDVQPAAHLAWLEAPARALVPPDARALVSAPLPARVVRVRVRPGDAVAAGQPLVDVVMPELISSAGALSAASMRLSAFERRHERLRDLLEQGLARAAEVAELEAQMALARADRESARATLRSAGVSDAQAVGALAAGGTTSLRAPIAGMVIAVNAVVGEVREPSSSALIEIAQNTSAQIEARFGVEPRPEHAFEWIEATRRVPLELQAVSPAASGETGARIAWLRARDASEGPAPGALGRVRLVPPESWVVIPASALHSTPDGQAVRVHDSPQGKIVPVHVVMKSGAEAVVDGVRVGQRVAVVLRQASGGHEH